MLTEKRQWSILMLEILHLTQKRKYFAQIANKTEGGQRLAGDTAREATSDEVKDLKAEARQLKETWPRS
jgi:hypothetical protein